MPTYDYACASCGGFDAFRSLAERNEPVACPDCGAASARVFATAPRLALMDSGTRHAMATNERARHEPQRSSEYARLRHPPGCGCCSTAGRKATVTAPNGNKAFPSKRPWMISH
ncbi:MAG: zinc ribbon domain-containing protein [Rhodoferax sp.]|uniref:FmdB family zinc ribbon protein n=1 Tax=Rhodoferax sp. TaxID=50421 RepID=UPI0026173E34|nr:zinc ribbon domain-containing protein [Rhodoferax sp.]MDD2880538.1 zinc ribbon domain-containing protein [Rhodoferax sp.]